MIDRQAFRRENMTRARQAAKKESRSAPPHFGDAQHLRGGQLHGR
jgi:hypothetical protein